MFSLVAYSSDLMPQNQNGRTSQDDSAECGGTFRYVSLMNRTSSFDSNVVMPTVTGQLKRSTSDQALPDSASVDSKTFRAADLDRRSRTKSSSQEPSSLELNVLKGRDDEPGPCVIGNFDRTLVNLNNAKTNTALVVTTGQHVPSRSINNSVLSTSSLGAGAGGGDDRRNNRREINGQLILNNVNLSMDEAAENGPMDDDEISYSHIRYVNIFAIMCCWCFPLTGIFTIVYSRLAKKYYDMRDKENAKKYLSKSEWLLMLTFFFGLTLIAVLLAFLDAYYFKTLSKDLHRGALISRILH